MINFRTLFVTTVASVGTVAMGLATLQATNQSAQSPNGGDCAYAFAQPGGGRGPGGPGGPGGPRGRGMGPGGGPEERVERLVEILSLTEGQAMQIVEIHEATREQVRSILENTAIPAEVRHEQVKALRETTHQQIRALLTAEQQAIFDGLPKLGKMGPLGHLAERLELTEQQIDQIAVLHILMYDQLRALANSGEFDPEAGRAIHEATHEKVRAVLTPEQQAIFDQMPKRGPGHGPRGEGGRGEGPGQRGGPRGGRGAGQI